MLIKKLCIAGIVAMSLAAVAQRNVIESASGRGRAVNSDRVHSFFGFEVARVHDDHGDHLVGHLRFASRTDRATVEIGMGAPARLGINADTKVAEFGGDGRMVVRTHDGMHHFAGHVAVRVQDRRHGQKGDPDTFRIMFDGDHDVHYAFDGMVDEGDIIVRPHH